MDINWLGHSCFRIKGKDASIITDPFNSSIGYALKKTSADIITLIIIGIFLIPFGLWVFSRAEIYAKKTGKMKRSG